MTERTRRTCILIELTDGSVRAFKYPDEEMAATWYEECRGEWNAGRTIIFNLRRSSVNRFAPSTEMHDGDGVSHLGLTTPAEAERRGAMLRDAVIFE